MEEHCCELKGGRLVVGEEVEDGDEEADDQSSQHKLVLVLHHPEHWAEERHPPFDFVEIVLFSFEVLIELVFVLDQRLDFLIPGDPFDSYFELLLHFFCDLFGDG